MFLPAQLPPFLKNLNERNHNSQNRRVVPFYFGECGCGLAGLAP